MSAIAPAHPSKKVAIAGWDSEEEGERSRRGIEFRQKLKKDSQRKKMAHQLVKRNILAEKVYNVLILPDNHGRLNELARNEDNFIFEGLEPAVNATRRVPSSLLWLSRRF